MIAAGVITGPPIFFTLAGVPSMVKAAFLKLVSMCYITFAFILSITSCIYKAWVSKLHPASAVSLVNIASLKISNMSIAKI